jgi:hypothetical protein
MLKAKFASEPVGATKGLRSEPRQMVNVMRSPFREQFVQQRVRKDLCVEQFLCTVQRLVAAGVIVKAPHIALLGLLSVASCVVFGAFYLVPMGLS